MGTPCTSVRAGFGLDTCRVYYPETDIRNQEHAKACLEAAITADAFVLIDNNTFNGAFGAIVEYGAAVTHGVPCVIVKPLTRESIFMTLPNVRIVESVDDVEQAINDIKSQLDS